MTTYYHSSPLLLSPGSIVQPGNWGRILNCYRYDPQAMPNAWLLARELVYETIRAAQFPNLPSRLSCAFAFESIDHANQCMNEFSPWNSLYEIELLEPNAPSHRGGFNLIRFPAPNVEFLPVVAQSAEAYWRGESIEIAELITKSPLKIKTLVSSGPRNYQP